MSECGRLCQRDGSHEEGQRYRRALMLHTLLIGPPTRRVVNLKADVLMEAGLIRAAVRLSCQSAHKSGLSTCAVDSVLGL